MDSLPPAPMTTSSTATTTPAPGTQPRFGVVSVYLRKTVQGGKVFESWEPEDRNILKKLLAKFQSYADRGMLKLSSLCTHTKGKGGVKRAQAEVDAAVRTGEYTHV